MYRTTGFDDWAAHPTVTARQVVEGVEWELLDPGAGRHLRLDGECRELTQPLG